MDYDCRAHVLKEDLTRAVARMVLDIDGIKFKLLTSGPYGSAARLWLIGCMVSAIPCGAPR
jgi:hypothetical protein